MWVVLDIVLQEKYIGVLLSHDMSWSNHIHTIATKANQKLSSVFSVATWKEVHLTVRNLLMLLWCVPHLSMESYGIHTFRRMSTVSLELVQRKASRWVTSTYDRKSSVSRLMRELQWETLQEHRRIQRLTFITRFPMVRWRCQPNWLIWNYLNVQAEETIINRSWINLEHTLLNTSNPLYTGQFQSGILFFHQLLSPTQYLPSSVGCPLFRTAQPLVAEIASGSRRLLSRLRSRSR